MKFLIALVGFLLIACGEAETKQPETAVKSVATPEQINVVNQNTTGDTYDKDDIRTSKVLPDRIMGQADAPITVIEYASFTCGHCGNFHRNVLPTLKKDYIDTGKVRYVYRDFPLDELALMATQLTRCMPKDQYFGFVDVVYSQQDHWVDPQEGKARLKRMAAFAGMDGAAIDKCLNNEPLKQAIIAERLRASKKYKVEFTPTIIVNGVNKGSIGKPEEMIKALK